MRQAIILINDDKITDAYIHSLGLNESIITKNGYFAVEWAIVHWLNGSLHI